MRPLKAYGEDPLVATGLVIGVGCHPPISWMLCPEPSDRPEGPEMHPGIRSWVQGAVPCMSPSLPMGMLP